MGDKREKWGVNISGGTVNVGGNVEQQDIVGGKTISVKTKAPRTEQTSQSPDHNEPAVSETWTKDNDQDLANRSGVEISQPIGKVIFREWKDAKGTHREVGDDKPRESKVRLERGVDGCPKCGASFSTNPYKKECEYCGKDIGQHTFERVYSVELDPIQENTKKPESQAGDEEAVRKIIDSPTQINSSSDESVDGAYTTVEVNSSSDITFNDVVVLHSVVINMSADITGTIIVPPGFKGVQKNMSSDCSLKVVKKSWAEIYAIVG